MKYLIFFVLLAGCTAHKEEPKMSKKEICQKQAHDGCLDIGDEDETEQEICEIAVIEECMKK